MQKRIFLSYCWEDTDVMNQLQKQLHLHGLTTWRDKNKMRFGNEMEQTCRNNVRYSQECDSYLLLVSKHSLASDPVIHWELDAAVERNKEDPGFSLYFLFYDIDVQDASKIISEKIPGLDVRKRLYMKQQGELQSVEVYTKIATDIVRNKLETYIAHELIENNTLVLNYETRSINAKNKAHFEINLCDYYAEGRYPSRDQWAEEIMPALKRLKNIFSDTCGTDVLLKIQSDAHLAAFVPLGFSFPIRSGFHFSIDGEFMIQGKKQVLECLSKREDVVDEKPLVEDVLDAQKGDSTGVILEVSIVRDVADTVDKYLQEQMHLQGCARYALKSPEADRQESGGSSVKSPEHMAQMVRQFELYLQGIQMKHPGQPIYWFISVPKGIALMMGHRIRVFEAVHFHEYIDGKYQEAVRLA